MIKLLEILQEIEVKPEVNSIKQIIPGRSYEILYDDEGRRYWDECRFERISKGGYYTFLIDAHEELFTKPEIKNFIKNKWIRFK